MNTTGKQGGLEDHRCLSHLETPCGGHHTGWPQLQSSGEWAGGCAVDGRGRGELRALKNSLEHALKGPAAHEGCHTLTLV